MHTLLIYELSEDYMEKRGALRKEHIDLVNDSYAKGELQLAGALSEPVDQAVLVFRGDIADKVEAFAKADPYVTQGLVKEWKVRKWNTVIGEGSTPPKL